MSEECKKASGSAAPAFTEGSNSFVKCVLKNGAPAQIVEVVTTSAAGVVTKSYFEKDGVTPFVGVPSFVQCPDFVFVANQVASTGSGPVDPCCPATNNLLSQISTNIAAIAGNTDAVETLQAGTTAAVTSLTQYIDQVEGLLNTLFSNTDQLESLATALGLQTDQLEPLLTSILGNLKVGPNCSGDQALLVFDTCVRDSITVLATATATQNAAILAGQTAQTASNVSQATSINNLATAIANQPAPVNTTAAIQSVEAAIKAQLDTEYFQGLICVDGTTRPYRIATAFKMLDGTISNESAIETWDGTGWFPIDNSFAFKDGSCEEIEKFSVLNQTLFEIKKLNLVEACVSFPAGTTSTIQKFRVDALWGPNVDANGDPDGTFYGGFAEIRKEGLPVVPLQTIPHVAGSFTATGFSSAGTAFGIVWDVDTLFFGSQTITANGQPALMNAQGQANDNVSLSYTYVDVVTNTSVPGLASVSKLVDFSQPTPVYYELDGVTVYVKPANAIVKLGAPCPKACTDTDVDVVKECNSAAILAATLSNVPLPQTFDLVAREHLAQIELAVEKPRVTTEHMRLVDPVTGIAVSPATTIIVTSTYAVGSSVPSNSYVNMTTGAAWSGSPETQLRALPPPALPVVPIVAPVELAITSKFTRASGTTLIASGYKSVSVLAISNNVTIDGQAIPKNVSTQVGSASMERFSDTITIIGTDYFLTETR